MAVIETAQQAGVYRLAERFAERALRADRSLHTSARVWTRTALDDLATRFREQFPTTSGTFEKRWVATLEGASGQVRRLAAEALCVHLLFPADIAGATKRRLVAATDPDLHLPEWVEAALGAGVTRTGVAFKAARLSQIAFLVRAVRDWKGLATADRRSHSSAPQAFMGWLRDVPAEGGQSQREALLHLLYPDAFEPIVSMPVKRSLADAFAEHVRDEADDVDAALRQIRGALEPEHGTGFWFTDPAVMARWKPG